MNLLQMSLSGAVMILVIVVIRALAINKLPKKTFLVLWGVVMVRLLIPYSLRSAFSVYSLLEQFAPTAETVNGSPAVPFIPMILANNMTHPPTIPAVDTASVPVDPWMVIWLIGALACAVFFAVAYLKCHREFKASLPVDNEYVRLWLSEHRIHRTIEIRQSGRISAPLTYGVFRPVILMPKTADWDDLDTLKYVLAHEYVHIHRFDAVTKLVLTVALCVHWFNPAVWIMYVLANRDIEFSCDEAVIREFGERTKSSYAMALIRMEEARNGLTPLCNNFSKNAIEARIIAIMKIKKTSMVALIVAAVLVVGVTTAFATSAEYVSDTVMEKSDILNYTQEQLEEKLIGLSCEDMHNSWGEPDDFLSGFWGDIWDLDDNNNEFITPYHDVITLYYDENGYVENIVIGSRINKTVVDNSAFVKYVDSDTTAQSGQAGQEVQQPNADTLKEDSERLSRDFREGQMDVIDLDSLFTQSSSAED